MIEYFHSIGGLRQLIDIGRHGHRDGVSDAFAGEIAVGVVEDNGVRPAGYTRDETLFVQLMRSHSSRIDFDVLGASGFQFAAHTELDVVIECAEFPSTKTIQN